MSVDRQLERERNMVLVISLVIWEVTIFGITLASAIWIRMPGLLAILFAGGVALGSTPFGLIAGWIVSRMLKSETSE